MLPCFGEEVVALNRFCACSAAITVLLFFVCLFDVIMPLDGASLVVQTIKSLPAMQETWVLSLGQEDPLEKGMATYSSILVWRIPWTEETGGLQSMGSQRVRHD